MEIEVEGSELREIRGDAGFFDVLEKTVFECPNVFYCQLGSGWFERAPENVEFFEVICGERFDIRTPRLTELH